MKKRSPQFENASRTDMTPMVDVTFLLLIFFMVTAAFSLRRAIEMPSPLDERPGRVAQQRDDAPKIRLVIDHSGGFLLLTRDTQYQLIGKQSLTEHLTIERRRLSADQVASTHPIRIEVDSDVRLQRLVDAMDSASIAGFDRLVVTELSDEIS